MLLHIDTYIKGGKGTKHVQKCSVYVIRFDKKVKFAYNNVAYKYIYTGIFLFVKIKP